MNKVTEKIKIIQMTENEIEDRIINAIRRYEKQKEIKEQEQTLLSKKEAADRLGISYNTLMKRVNEGFIKVRTDGKIPKSSIDFYLSL